MHNMTDNDYNCPDCDFGHDKAATVFTHRVKSHTDAGDGDSFNLYDDEVFTIFMEMAWDEAVIKCESDEPSVDDVIQYLNTEMNIPVTSEHVEEHAVIEEEYEYDETE